MQTECDDVLFPPAWLVVHPSIRKPWVCGVSSLGIDHTQILGDTIEKIAWQKGGIFKVRFPYNIERVPPITVYMVLKKLAKVIVGGLREVTMCIVSMVSQRFLPSRSSSLKNPWLS